MTIAPKSRNGREKRRKKAIKKPSQRLSTVSARAQNPICIAEVELSSDLPREMHIAGVK